MSNCLVSLNALLFSIAYVCGWASLYCLLRALDGGLSNKKAILPAALAVVSLACLYLMHYLKGVCLIPLIP